MKIQFTAVCRISSSEIRHNISHAEMLGLPLVQAKHPRLAVVGGGPSLVGELDFLRAWDGEIWSINGAHRFLLNHGISSTFFTVDPSPIIADMCLEASQAVLALRCHPSSFEAVANGDVSCTTLHANMAGATSASCVPSIILESGHKQVVFFGCESSFVDSVHAYPNVSTPASRLLVECGGDKYLTSPDLFMQAEFLSAIIRAAPSIFSERSGGLLRAMICYDWDIVAASRSIHQGLAHAA